jgi:hypothetical protein
MAPEWHRISVHATLVSLACVGFYLIMAAFRTRIALASKSTRHRIGAECTPRPTTKPRM